MAEANVETQKNLYIPFSVLILIISGCIGSLFVATKSNEIAIERVNTHMAKTYITTDQAKEGFDDMSEALIRMDNRIQNKLNKIDDKLGK